MDISGAYFPSTRRHHHTAQFHQPSSFYTMLNPNAGMRPTTLLTATTLVGVPPSRNFVTTTVASSQFRPPTPEEMAPKDAREGHNAGTFLFGMMSRLIGGLMKTVEEIVSPKRVVSEPVSPRAEVLDLGMFISKSEPPTPVASISILSPPKSAPASPMGSAPNKKSHKVPRRHSATKNRLEKKRHELVHDIMEAIASDEDDFVGSFEHVPERHLKVVCEKTASPEDKCNNNSFLLVPEDFPAIDGTVACPRQLHLAPVPKKCEAFVIFDTKIVKYTPSTGPMSPLKQIFGRLRCRRRTMSEQSDDGIVFFDDSEGCLDSSSDTEGASDSESDESEVEDDETDDEVDFRETTQKGGQSQFDSGFEEEVKTKKPKKVEFDLNPRVHVMHKWDFAYRNARIGLWEQYGRDAERFGKRIRFMETQMAPVLEAKHREKVFQERFAADSH